MTTLTIDGLKDKLENKYYRIYGSLIKKRLERPPESTFYTELHHILPKSLGGTNHQSNLVLLTAKEHFIAHLLLTKFVVGPDRLKVIRAFLCMNNMSNTATKGRYITSRKYDLLKEEFAMLQSERSKELWKNDTYSQLVTEKIKDSWYNGKRDLQIQYMKNNSPFRSIDVHKKSIDSRERNGTNVWKTNNPMKDPLKAKQIASKRSGGNHYLTKQIVFEYSLDSGSTWNLIDRTLTVDQICDIYNWSRATFYYIIDGKIPKRGSMKGLLIRRVKNEDSEDRKVST